MECLQRLLKTIGPYETQKKRHILQIKGPQAEHYLSEVTEKIDFLETEGTLGIDEANQKFDYKIYKSPAGPHPIEALRPFAMADAIQHTTIDNNSKTKWINFIQSEVTSMEFAKESNVGILTVNKHSVPPQLVERKVAFAVARLSAEVAANILLTTKLSSLGGKKITEIFNWSLQDELQVDQMIKIYQNRDKPPPSKTSANHIVAAAVIEASTKKADIGNLFQAMKQYLKQLYLKT